MIHEIDEVLRTLIRARALPEQVSDVEFGAPTREWAARRNAPTVNAFLYDIREDVTRRERGPIAVRGPAGEVVARRQPPRWFRLSYLLTAWTSRAQDEHRLLSALLMHLMRFDALPAEELTENLVALGLPITMSVGVSADESRSVPDIWSALGGELKPSLELTVLAPFSATPEHPVGPPVTEDFTLEVRDTTEPRTDVAVRTFGTDG